MKPEVYKCRKCGTVLTPDNTYKTYIDNHDYVCVECKRTESRLNSQARRGGQSMQDNKQCTQYLGVVVGETVLSKMFKDVKRMPITNKGYDFMCSRGRKVDVKTACEQMKPRSIKPIWYFNIFKNQIADYFICVAFDNRDELNPKHIWMIPSEDVKDVNGISVSEHSKSKWDDYELDLDRLVFACDMVKIGSRMKTVGNAKC